MAVLAKTNNPSRNYQLYRKLAALAKLVNASLVSAANLVYSRWSRPSRYLPAIFASSFLSRSFSALRTAFSCCSLLRSSFCCLR